MTLNQQKIALVTGASSGLGKEIALLLAKNNVHVIMVCRDQKKGAAALADIQSQSHSTKIDLLMADLSSQADILALAKTLHDKYQQINILINNAGLVSTKKIMSTDGIEMTLATNYLAPFLLTNLLIDLLKNGAPARVIHISSAIHKWAKLDLDDLQFSRRKYHFMRAYAQSKLLLNMISNEFARRLNGTGITVNCIHPGAVKTNLGSQGANNIFLKWLDKAIKYFFITSEIAAKAPVFLALSDEHENTTGKYFVKNKMTEASKISQDINLQKKLWEVSERLTTPAPHHDTA